MGCSPDDVIALARSESLRLRAVARLILRDTTEAEDVVQETLTRLWQHRQTVRPVEARAWLKTVARNEAIDRVRKRRPLHPDPPPLDLPDVLGSAALAGTGERVDVLRALAALDRKYGHVLALRFLADVSEDETALVLGLPKSTVKSRTRQGLARLRSQLTDEGGGR